MKKSRRSTADDLPKCVVCEQITDNDLPKCVVCEQAGKRVCATFLAFIGVRVGKQEWQDWHLVCRLHRATWPAFELVKVAGRKRLAKRHKVFRPHGV